MASFTKFVRPKEPKRGQITDRDLNILSAVLRYRFVSAAQLVRLVGGNEDVTHRRLRTLWEQRLVSRWAFPGLRSHSEFYYYLDDRSGLELLSEMRGLEISPDMLSEIKNHRDKDYANAAARGQHMQLGFLNHELMISRMHFCVEMAARKSGGQVSLETWQQGRKLTGRKVDVAKVRGAEKGGQIFYEETEERERLPVEPDALFTLRFRERRENDKLVHFMFEADRGTMTGADMIRKFRAYYHLIKRQQGHIQAFGVHPIRAVLIETTDELRGRRLMELVHHPTVCGPAKKAGLFWFTISPVLVNPVHLTGQPRYLSEPQIVHGPIWATSDHQHHRITDQENRSADSA